MNLKEHEKVLAELREQDPDIVFDGAVNNDFWTDSKTRILWVLKETNGLPKDRDLRVLLKQFANDSNPNGIYANWQSTYGAVVQVSYGIINGCIEWGAWADDVDGIRGVLNKIAVININKQAGGAKSNWKELKEATKKFKDIVLQQIELLDPTIVILGGVGDIISEWIPEFSEDRKVIIVYHPCQSKMTRKSYYELIRKEVSK